MMPGFGAWPTGLDGGAPCQLGVWKKGLGRWGRAEGDLSSLDREFKLSEGQPRIEDQEAFGYMGIW